MKSPGIACLWLLLGASGAAVAQQVPQGQLDVPGALFRYSAEGSGPVVVAFTGSENLGHAFYTDRLRKDITLVYADPARLHGAELARLTMNTVLEDIERVRQFLELDRISVMGHSMFGVIPLEYALKYPAHVQWAIISGALPFTTARAFGASEGYWDMGATQERKDLLAANRKALVAHAPEKLTRSEAFWARYLADIPLRFANARFDMAALARAAAPTTNMDFVNHFWGVVLKDYDNSAAYRQVRTPVLVIGGKYDFGAPPFLWEEVCVGMPDCTLHVFENAGHNPMLEVPEEFDRILSSWMRKRM